MNKGPQQYSIPARYRPVIEHIGQVTHVFKAGKKVRSVMVDVFYEHFRDRGFSGEQLRQYRRDGGVGRPLPCHIDLE